MPSQRLPFPSATQHQMPSQQIYKTSEIRLAVDWRLPAKTAEEVWNSHLGSISQIQESCHFLLQEGSMYKAEARKSPLLGNSTGCAFEESWKELPVPFIVSIRWVWESKLHANHMRGWTWSKSHFPPWFTFTYSAFNLVIEVKCMNRHHLPPVLLGKTASSFPASIKTNTYKAMSPSHSAAWDQVCTWLHSKGGPI